MNLCAICRHGVTRPGTVTVTLERRASIVIFREVPARICGNCGETYHDADITKELLRQAEQAVSEGVEVNVRRFHRLA
ncbi:type II toxin-antitoxin system MqsA family antitoxin [Methylococcus sp. ANG]|uniref:type II toxin-antitoxin system MqsA family antitoxin n=1 Tax=Methylococcus sp. ANG TaxID=3231903 RepID=UPI0034588AB7